MPTNVLQILEMALRRLPDGAAFSGFTAAWLHGLDVPPCSPIEVTVPEDAGVSGRAGMVVHRTTFNRGDVVEARGLAVTSRVRTVGELCSRLELVEAVVIADAALHVNLTSLRELNAWATSHAYRRGIRTLRRVLKHAEPKAESPMESRLRMVLVLGRLPRPEAQVPIRDSSGRILGVPDLYYARQRVGIEFDGATHRDSLAEDNRRQNLLLSVGVRLLRFSAADVYRRGSFIVAQVRGVLATAGSRRVT